VGPYLVRRLLLALSIVGAVSFAAFVGFGLSFDPSYPLHGNPRAQAIVRSHYDLQGPILPRYWHWLTGVFHHGFGTTVSTDVGGAPPHFLTYGDPIWPQVWRASSITAQLVGASLVLVILGSAAVGTIAAQRRRFRLDVSSRVVAYVVGAVPTFLISDLLLRAIVPHTSFVVIGGRYQISSHGSWFVLGPPTGGAVDWFRHMTLPVLALAIGLIGIYSRYIRSAMIVALREPYVMVARAKGLPERRVLVRHALRNSLIPFTSLLSLELGGVVGASIAADAVFGTGGLASTFLGALARADPFELTALFVMTGVVVCTFMFVGDALVGVLDPRTRAATA
jgi:glutathione transport system permease protein